MISIDIADRSAETSELRSFLAAVQRLWAVGIVFPSNKNYDEK